MKRILLFIIILLPIVFQACTPKSGSNQQESTLSPDEYKKSFLVDVRTPEEFAAGSVPGAINIPINEIPNRIDEFKNKENVVVFCRTGNRSSQAKKILNDNGIRNVTNGGSWQQVKAKVE